MKEVYCNVKDCKWHCDINRCSADEVIISDEELRADGYYPRCHSYEEVSE